MFNGHYHAVLKETLGLEFKPPTYESRFDYCFIKVEIGAVYALNQHRASLKSLVLQVIMISGSATALRGLIESSCGSGSSFIA